MQVYWKHMALLELLYSGKETTLRWSAVQNDSGKLRISLFLLRNFLKSPVLELAALMVEVISLPNNIFRIGESTPLKIPGANLSLALRLENELLIKLEWLGLKVYKTYKLNFIMKRGLEGRIFHKRHELEARVCLQECGSMAHVLLQKCEAEFRMLLLKHGSEASI